jgi:hypothetical protein
MMVSVWSSWFSPNLLRFSVWFSSLKMSNRIFTPKNCDCCSKKLFHHHVTIDIGPLGDSEDFLANSRMPKSDVRQDEVDMKIFGRTEKGQLSEGSLSLCPSTLKQQFSEGSLSLCTSALKQHLQRRSKKPKNLRRTSEKKKPPLGRLNI